MARIDAPENNPKYSTMNGVLFDKEKTLLISYSQTMNWIYIVPDGVKKIRVEAFCSYAD